MPEKSPRDSPEFLQIWEEVQQRKSGGETVDESVSISTSADEVDLKHLLDTAKKVAAVRLGDFESLLTPSQQPFEFDLPWEFGEYTLTEVINSGGMAVVYLSLIHI